MADDDQIDDALEDDLADGELAEDFDSDLGDDELDGDDELGGDDELASDEDKDDDEDEPAASGAKDDDEEDDDEADPDDVEADLGEILKDRIAAGDDEDEDEDEPEEPSRTTETPGRIQPRRSDEFLCQACFILKPRAQLADGESDLCVDCV